MGSTQQQQMGWTPGHSAGTPASALFLRAGARSWPDQATYFWRSGRRFEDQDSCLWNYSIFPIFGRWMAFRWKGNLQFFSPGALHLLVMETALKYKNKGRKKIKEEDQKSLSCRELGLVKPCWPSFGFCVLILYHSPSYLLFWQQTTNSF